MNLATTITESMKAGAAKSWAKQHHEKGRRKQRNAFFDAQRVQAEKVVRDTVERLKVRLGQCAEEDLPPSWRAANLTRVGLLTSLRDVDNMIVAKKVPWERCGRQAHRSVRPSAGHAAKYLTRL